MKRFLLSVFLGFCLIPTAKAHDFWLGPSAFQMEAPGQTSVSIMIGHPEDKMRWPLNPHRVVSLRSVGPEGINDHQRNIKARTSEGDLILSFETTGMHLLAIETTSAESVLGADKFNAYLDEEGLTPIKKRRFQTGTMDEAGREIYSRRGKALINVGTHTQHTHSDGHSHYPDYVTRPLGMTLEIVPNENPYSLEENAPFQTTLYYRGEPTEGVTIGLIRLDNNEGLVDSKKTNKNGQVTFPRPKEGNWMLHTVWSDPLENNAKAEFDTIFSSLSFGF